MRYPVVGIVFASLVLILAACGGSEEEPLPTLAPVEPTPTQEEIVEEAATPLPTATAFVRATLPPTWTPTPSPTPTSAADGGGTGSRETATPFVPATLNPACGTFGPDRAEMDTEFAVGDSPRIAWTGVDGAALYRVTITNETGFVVFDGLVEDATFLDVNPDVFAQVGPYGWDVIPLDPFGIQMCFGRGDMLLAE